MSNWTRYVSGQTSKVRWPLCTAVPGSGGPVARAPDEDYGHVRAGTSSRRTSSA